MTNDRSLIISRDHYLGIAITGPGLDLRAQAMAVKAGFITHVEQRAVVLPPGIGGDETDRRTRRALRLLYLGGYAVTLDATLKDVRTPIMPMPSLSPATAALTNAIRVLRVMPHPADTAALLNAVRIGPLARTVQLVDVAVAHADAVDDPEAARDARLFLRAASVHLVVAEAALSQGTSVLKAHARRQAAASPTAHPVEPTALDSRRRR